MKPNGHLLNTVAELVISIIDERKNAAVKRVVPVRVATYLLEGNFDCKEVKRELNKKNNLHHRQMVMFPVLQKLEGVQGSKDMGHYYLLVLNLRNKQFEVLDSMRTLADDSLRQCCGSLIRAIKFLWGEYYSDTNIVIEDFPLVEINVPKQHNIHDCGYYMLLNAEHFDG